MIWCDRVNQNNHMAPSVCIAHVNYICTSHDAGTGNINCSNTTCNRFEKQLLYVNIISIHTLQDALREFDLLSESVHKNIFCISGYILEDEPELRMVFPISLTSFLFKKKNISSKEAVWKSLYGLDGLDKCWVNEQDQLASQVCLGIVSPSLGIALDSV